MFAESKRHILYNVFVDTYTEEIAMRTIHVEFSDERLITPSGLVFVGQILGKSDFVKKMNRAPDIELETYWTNLPISDQEIIDLYHAHGESEQYHSEIKRIYDCFALST